MWGVEVFWIAFVTAFPQFPFGAWPTWDPAILLNGPFITTRMASIPEPVPESTVSILMSNSIDNLTATQDDKAGIDEQHEQSMLWVEFKQLVSLLQLPLH
jgi:hypothetical protein